MALIVLNIEILSIFRAISDINILIFSFLNLIISFIIFKYKKANFLIPKFDFQRLKNSFKLDKTLFILAFAFLFFLMIVFFLAFVMPPSEPDSQTYHFLRAVEFFENRTLAHFETNDIRALVMPINSEIIYCWMLTLKKTFFGYGIVSFLSYIFSIFSIWNIMEFFKIAFRKRLWTIFVFSSFASIIVQTCSLQTDILVGCLALVAFYLYLKKKIYVSSLALALALGVKSTGVILSFGFFVLIIGYEFLISKRKSYKPVVDFFIYLVINFLIFSSYNYFLNFIQFSSFLSNNASYLGHRAWGGVEGFCASLIHFFFQGFDFTGFMWGYYLNHGILALKIALMNILHINPYIGCNVPQEQVNILADEQTIGFGILGFLVYMPVLFYSIINFFVSKNKNKRTKLYFLLGIVFIINIIVLSIFIAYMVFSIRFVVAFMCLSSIIITLSYSKKSACKAFKIIVTLFCLFYLLLISTHIKRMPFFKIFQGVKNSNYNLNQFSKNVLKGDVIETLKFASLIDDTVKNKFPDKKNIVVIKSLSSSALYLKTIDKKERKYNFIKAFDIDKINLKNYDLIILENVVQNDNVFNPWDVKINYEIKNDKITFLNSDNLNCYYVDFSSKITLEPYNALERVCFSYEYLLKNKDFKLSHTQNMELKKSKIKFDIFFFTKLN